MKINTLRQINQRNHFKNGQPIQMFILTAKFQTLRTKTNENVTKHFKLLVSLNEGLKIKFA